MGRKNNAASPVKTFEGVANAPFIPSIQIAYNMEHWSLQANLSVPGGGGSCEFDNGLGSFESTVGNIANMLKPFGAQGYDMDSYMKGRQYYYGLQIGAACKVIPNLSLYGGLRMLYGDATYKAKLSNIQVKTANGYMDFGGYLQQIAPAAKAAGYGEQIAALEKYSDGVNLLCNQAGVGFAPIVGIDYRIGHFNIAAKYEFRTQIRMKNESTVNEASEIPAVNKFRDGEKVNEDVPAMATLGVQYSPIDQVRFSIGGHYFFDKDASWYGNSQENLSHNTYEILWGAEWDTTENLTFSAGAQITRYGNTNEYINDMSFVVNSYSIGFGFSYKLSQKVAIKAAYFQTYYGDYERTDANNPEIKDIFTRTNRVFGVGCQLDL
jgi:long-chain fatty acid transport protein